MRKVGHLTVAQIVVQYLTNLATTRRTAMRTFLAACARTRWDRWRFSDRESTSFESVGP